MDYIKKGSVASVPACCYFMYFVAGSILCGIYSMNNPDAFVDERTPMKYCWAQPTQEPNFIITDGEVSGATNVTLIFITWFKYGFWLNISMLFSSCCCCAFSSLSVAFDPETAHLVVIIYNLFCLAFAWGIGGLVWIISGMYFRWN